jgi:hypothetical protein
VAKGEIRVSFTATEFFTFPDQKKAKEFATTVSRLFAINTRLDDDEARRAIYAEDYPDGTPLDDLPIGVAVDRGYSWNDGPYQIHPDIAKRFKHELEDDKYERRAELKGP